MIGIGRIRHMVERGEAGPAPELLEALDSQPASSTELIRLAALVKEVSALGAREQQACEQILRVFQEYSAAAPTGDFGLGLNL